MMLLGVNAFEITNFILTIISILFGLPTIASIIIFIVRRLNINQFYNVFFSTVLNSRKPNSLERFRFMHYVKHSFTLENIQSEDIDFKGFINNVKETKIVILTGSAGVGKSILMQRLALQFRSGLQKGKTGQILDDYGVLFYKLNRQSDLEKILNEVEEKIKTSSIPYSLYLDGLDEIPELSIRSGSEILNNLLIKLLSGISQKCGRIFISLRPEILDGGYSFNQPDEQNILLFKVKNFEDKQILDMYRNENRRPTEKINLKTRRQNLKKLKSVIKNNTQSVFTYPLILTWANEILSDYNIKDLTYISWYDALGKVIENELDREYKLYRNAKGVIIGDTDYSHEQFVKDGKEFLIDIALNMALSDAQLVTKERVLSNHIVKRFNKTQNEVTGNTFISRRLLRYVDWSEKSNVQPYYEFIHNTVYWRALAEAILNPDTPQNLRSKIILKYANGKYSTPLRNYCYQGLWSLQEDEVFPYIDYLSYMRAVNSNTVKCKTNNNIPLEILLSCFYGFKELEVDYTIKFYTKVINDFVENAKLNLSNSNIANLDILDYFGENSFKILDCSKTDIEKAIIPDYIKEIDFFDCKRLKGVYITDLAAWCNIEVFGWRNPMKYAPYLYLNGELITKLLIPDGVTKINKSVFENCLSLKEIFIPNSVTEIGVNAFAGCNQVNKITVGENVKKICFGAFSFCTNLTEINFNAMACEDFIDETYNGLKGSFRYDGNKYLYNIFDSAGQNGDGITVNFAANVKKIPTGLFFVFSGVQNELPPKITKVNFAKDSLCTQIGDYAFSDCKSFERFYFPDKLKSIGKSAFLGCSGLADVTLPNGIEDIGSCAFYWCESLKNISIPDSVKNIGNRAFGCCPIETINIGEGVEFVGDNLFIGCNLLTEISVDGGNRNYKSVDGNLYSIDGKILIEYARGKHDKTFIVPDGTTVISERKFCGCAFQTVVIPDSVVEIQEEAFADCSSLKNIILPDGVRRIGFRAFKGCEALENITISKNVESIGMQAFELCSSLKRIDVVQDNAHFKSIDGNLYSKDGTLFIKYVNGKSQKQFNIPDGVVKICENAFSYIEKLCCVTIPHGVKEIGSVAFYMCSSLANIIIPNSVERMGDASLAVRNIPESIILLPPEQITYKGTVREWNNIIYDNKKICRFKFTKIICTDGIIED